MKRSNLQQLRQDDFFFWATGIEDTFITEPWPATGRTLDEYELTQHYARWSDDLDLIQQSGVTHARYGIPWHRINPAANTWDWEFADKTLGRLLDLGIEPIVDLVHYGLPRWIQGAYLNPDFPKHMAEYVARATERFKGRIHLWTPLNEPRVTAWYCGKLGWWPPFRRGWSGFVQVMIAVCRGIVEAVKAIQAADAENVAVHVDATDLYETGDPSLSDEVSRRQEIVFLALDLISGRLHPGHPLHDWLRSQSVPDETLQWFSENAVTLDLVGINLYPLFSKKVLVRSPHLRIKMPYAAADIVDRLAEMYYRRYSVPVFISETASAGSVSRRAAWLAQSIERVCAARSRGVPLVGYTWWPLFALVTWAYRQGQNAPEYYLKQMGLWDLKVAGDARLERIPTSLVEQYRSLTRSGTSSVGLVKPNN